jgi:hypothetical protein
MVVRDNNLPRQAEEYTMGIGYHMVEALIRESQHKPIRGDVVLIGRQTVYFSPESILDLLNQHGIDVKDHQSADLETGGLSNLNMPDRPPAFDRDSDIIDQMQTGLLPKQYCANEAEPAAALR